MRVLQWCVWIFVATVFFGIMDIHLFQYIPDVRKEPQRGAKLFESFLSPLRDRQFLWFAGFVGMMTFAISFMGQFVTLYLMERVRMTNFSTQAITLVRSGQEFVDLAPRPSSIRRRQHELAHRARLESESFGDEPKRRVRISNRPA